MLVRWVLSVARSSLRDAVACPGPSRPQDPQGASDQARKRAARARAVVAQCPARLIVGSLCGPKMRSAVNDGSGSSPSGDGERVRTPVRGLLSGFTFTNQGPGTVRSATFGVMIDWMTDAGVDSGGLSDYVPGLVVPTPLLEGRSVTKAYRACASQPAPAGREDRRWSIRWQGLPGDEPFRVTFRRDG